MSSDTIFAPITGVGGAVVVVRISGKNCIDVFEHLGLLSDVFISKPNYLMRAKIVCDGEFVDDAMVVFFKSPNSFTGDDTVELNLHASRFVLKRVLDVLSGIPSFRHAGNGEFAKMAFLNGKIDIIESEGINELIRAESQQQHRLASRLLAGGVSGEYEEIRKEVLGMMMIVESLIDFSDEDVPDGIFNDIEFKIKRLREMFTGFLSENHKTERVSSGIIVPVVGLPNAGKSSLMNCLMRRDVSIVSSIAGTTRDVVTHECEIGGFKVRLFDTAGFNVNADNEIEIEGINRARDVIKCSDLCIILIDVHSNIDDVLMQFSEIVFDNSMKKVFVLNKIDSINIERLGEVKLLFANVLKVGCDEFVLVSAKNSDIGDLVDRITVFFKENMYIEKPMLFNERHRSIAIAIMKIIDNFDTRKPIELLGEDLRMIAKLLGQVTGRVVVDDVLGEIFSKFCIGK
jgi:tRNA modification GTPase